MTKELLSQIANMELRDQLEAKEQMIKELKEKIKIYEKELEELLNMLKTVKELKQDD